MTHKDYVALAAAINEARKNLIANFVTLGDSPEMHSAELAGVLAVERTVAKVLAADNPRFDRERFIAACHKGVES